jgi:hypothetical protein
MKYLTWVLVLLLGGAHGNILRAAETLIAERNAAAKRLLALKKLTVGPDDQYQGTVENSGQFLIFTKKSEMVPHLCAQNLSSSEVTDLLPLSADSQESAPSPDGKLAFTYFQFSARGDICYRPKMGRVEDEIICLKPAPDEREVEKSSPFWKSNREIGYLVRDLKSQLTEIRGQNIDNGQVETLVTGRVWSPAMKPGGRYLFYNDLEDLGNNSVRVLKVTDLKLGTVKTLRFNLPGISGFPSVAEDEKTLFFSHYLNDSNNDNVIDGSDNSVIFRAPIASLLTGQPFFPEQLTSAENNCSLPKPFRQTLYVTCAQQGSLDVYSLPVSGIVPTGWTGKTLSSAHQTSRSYQDRILILNTLKFRAAPVEAKREIDEKLLSNHLFAQDTTASQYYVQELKKNAPESNQAFYELLDLYLQGLALKKNQLSEQEVSRWFRDAIEGLDHKVRNVRGENRFKQIVDALFQSFLNRSERASADFVKIDFRNAANKPVHPLERYFYFILANRVFPTLKYSARLAAVYRELSAATELSDENHIFYVFQFLVYLERVYENDLTGRLKQLHEFETSVNKRAQGLVSAEIAELELALATADDQGRTKDQKFGVLDRLMSESRADYFFRKALYVRAIINFAAAAEFKYLDLVATNWFSYTPSDDTEFSFAREVYVNATLDRAYDTFSQKNYNFAANYFYGALSLTDDLEAHVGYIRSMLLKNSRKVIDERYRSLHERKFIGDHLGFVRAFLAIADLGPEIKNSDTVRKTFDGAIRTVHGMDPDREAATRYLFLGYLYLQKMRLGISGYDFDHDAAAEAHRNLMLAYDTGRDNVRLRASALINLGILHQLTQNHGVAVKFFEKRKTLGFLSNPEKVSFTWLYAKSLFYNYQPDVSQAEITAVLNEVTPEPALLERKAFYLLSAGAYAEGVVAYEKLLAKYPTGDDLNAAKIYLAYGFVLYETKRAPAAEKALRQALGFTENLKFRPKSGERMVDFNPARLQIVIYGLLAQLGTGTEKTKSLEKRIALLEQSGAMFDDTASLILQNEQQLIEAVEDTNPGKTKLLWKSSLRRAEIMGDSGLWLSHGVYQTAVNYLVSVQRAPQIFDPEDLPTFMKILERCRNAYQSQKGPQPILAFQKIKLDLLFIFFESNVLKKLPPEKTRLEEFDRDVLEKISSEADRNELKLLRRALEKPT